MSEIEQEALNKGPYKLGAMLDEAGLIMQGVDPSIAGQIATNVHRQREASIVQSEPTKEVFREEYDYTLSLLNELNES